MRREEDRVLTEGHRIKRELQRWEFWSKLVFSALGFLLGVFLVAELKPSFYSVEDREFIKRQEEIRKLALRRGDFKSARLARESIEKVESKYPLPISPVMVFFYDYGGRRLAFLFLSMLPLLISLGIYAFLYHKLLKLKEFFYPVATKEEALKLSATPKHLFFYPELKRYSPSLLEKTFKDLKGLIRVMSAGTVGSLPEEEIRKEISSVLDLCLSHANLFYPFVDKEELKLYLTVLLWHFFVSFYGNVPTGLMAIYIKSKPLKIMLSLYQRRHLPSFFTGKEIKQDELKAYVYLRILYETDKRFKILNTLAEKYDILYRIAE